MLSEDEQKQIDHDAKNYYENVDWILDVSQAEFQEIEIDSSIPAKKVKRNPELHGIIYKEKVDIAKIENHEYICNLHKSYLRYNINSNHIIAVPSIKNKYMEEELESLRVLREEGIVYPN
jgi:hypothetical protein